MNNSSNGMLVNLSNQIDCEEIFSEFRERLSRLGDLKEFRSQHEGRSWFGRWWHKGDLEQAQLDAQVLQADFAESLAKLMAINLHMSSQLRQQQNTIGAQQDTLSKQNERLKEQTEALHLQQVELKEQGEDLTRLVEHFFELRGLTQNEARKLIHIANEVKSTKDDIYGRFDECTAELRSELSTQKQFVEDLSSQALSAMKAELAEALAEIGERQDELADRLYRHACTLEEHQRSIGMRLDGQDSLVAGVAAQLKQAIWEQGRSLQSSVDEVQAFAVEVERDVGTLFRRAMRRASWSLGIGSAGLVFGLGSLVAGFR